MRLFFWVATLGKLFTHICICLPSLLSSKKLWAQKGVFGLDRFNGLTAWLSALDWAKWLYLRALERTINNPNFNLEFITVGVFCNFFIINDTEMAFFGAYVSFNKNSLTHLRLQIKSSTDSPLAARSSAVMPQSQSPSEQFGASRRHTTTSRYNNRPSLHL